MSNLLFFGSGVAKGAGEFLDERRLPTRDR